MDSLWAFVFIGLAVAMAVGPVLIIKPNKRQQRCKEGTFALGKTISFNGVTDIQK